MKRFKNSPNFQVLKYSQFFLLNIEKRLRFSATLSLFMLLLRTKQFLGSRFSFLACLRWGEGSPSIGVMYRGRGFTMERANFTHKTSGGNLIFPRLSVRPFFFFGKKISRFHSNWNQLKQKIPTPLGAIPKFRKLWTRKNTIQEWKWRGIKRICQPHHFLTTASTQLNTIHLRKRYIHTNFHELISFQRLQA